MSDDNLDNKENLSSEQIVHEPRKKRFKIIIKIGIYLIGALSAWALQYYLTKKADDIDRGDISEKFIAVIMSKQDESFRIPQEFLTGFGGSTTIKANNNQIVRIDHIDDMYSTERAKSIADKFVNDDKCILIIGNSNSELSIITLNSILNTASDKRPSFILPIATADNIIERARAEKYRAILQMVPNNSNQAQVIKSFIAKNTQHQRIAIFVDEENSTYSNNLSSNIAAEVRKNGGQILLQKTYGNSNRLINNLNDLTKQKEKPEMIVFVGVSSNGLLLIDEISSLKLNIPIIFTDGCTVEELMNKTIQLKNKTYFLSAVSTSSNMSQATYKPIGIDAFALCKKIIEGISGNITKESVRKYIEEHKENLITEGGEAGNYKFNDYGMNENMSFNIYSYDENGILKLQKGF